MIKQKSGAKPFPLLVSIAVTVGIWFLPLPEGLDKNAWHLLAIFAGAIVGIMTGALPMGGMALLALTAIAITDTLPLRDALSGFSNPVVWLIVFAFLVAKSFVKTGLGFRIAYHLISFLGEKSLGLAYGMTLTDLVLSPAIPSNSARGGGIVYPIIKSLSLIFDSSPEKGTERRLGAFLFKNAYQVNVITSAMFLTAMAANPMMAEIAEEYGVEITWAGWALAAFVPGIISVIAIPWLLYKFYPPEIKETPEAKEIARKQLLEMGKMTWQEWTTLGVFFLMLFLWIFGGIYIIHFDDYYNISDVMLVKSESTTTAMIGVSILMITGVLEWKDVIEEKGAWNTLFWFSTLIMMAGFLSKLGVMSWMSASIGNSVVDVHWMTAYILLMLAYFYSHYFFASSTAHASSMFPAFLGIGIGAGISPLVMALSLAFTSNLSSCVTHYGMAPGPIFYGAGYVDLRTWWVLGALISIVHLIVWGGVGFLWWKVLGLW